MVTSLSLPNMRRGFAPSAITVALQLSMLPDFAEAINGVWKLGGVAEEEDRDALLQSRLALCVVFAAEPDTAGAPWRAAAASAESGALPEL